MKKYAFYDTYDNPEYQEYELKGEAYKELMQLCFRYCDTMSLLQWHRIPNVSEENEKFFTISPQSILIGKRFEKFQIDPPENINWSFSHYVCSAPRKNPQENFIRIAETSVKHYKLCPELFELMTTITHDIFWWADDNKNGLLEEPCFFRADGCCFFNSIVHEGELFLYLKEDEDASKLFSLSKWWTGEDIKRYI